MREFETIFRDFVPIVFRFLLSLCGDESLAEELTSETFYQAYLHIFTVFVGAADTGSLQPVAVPILTISKAAASSIAACLLATAIPLRKVGKMSIVESIETVE